MAREKFRDKPFYYKFLSILLRIASGMFITVALFFTVSFLVETPFYRLFDGISIAQIIMMALVLVEVVCFFIAWKNSLGGGVAAAFPVIAYTVIDSFETGAYSAGAENYIVLGLALLFILQGVLKKHVEHDRMEDILGPRIDIDEGPDLTNLRL